jgi:hypothetical protein
VRGNQVFAERLRATIGNTKSSNDDFFLDIVNLFGSLNMEDISNVTHAANAGANGAPYVIMFFMFQFCLEFLVLVYAVDAIGLSCLHEIFYLLW